MCLLSIVSLKLSIRYGTVVPLRRLRNEFVHMVCVSCLNARFQCAIGSLERIIALLLDVRQSVSPPVCLGRACIVIIRGTLADLSLWLDSPMFWAP